MWDHAPISGGHSRKDLAPAWEPGPDIRHTRRCSTAERMRYADHMANMFSEGLLTREEWELRHDACMTAVTLDGLKRMLRDVSPLPPEPELVSQPAMAFPTKPVSLALAALSAAYLSDAAITGDIPGLVVGGTWVVLSGIVAFLSFRKPGCLKKR